MTKQSSQWMQIKYLTKIQHTLAIKILKKPGIEKTSFLQAGKMILFSALFEIINSFCPRMS